MRNPVLSMFILVLLAACSKENNSEPDSLTGRIDGVSFECKSEIRTTSAAEGNKKFSCGEIGHPKMPREVLILIRSCLHSTDRVIISAPEPIRS